MITHKHQAVFALQLHTEPYHKTATNVEILCLLVYPEKILELLALATLPQAQTSVFFERKDIFNIVVNNSVTIKVH